MSTVLALLVPLAFLAWVIIAFNRLVRLQNQARNGWADVDVQLTRRHDLVPPLVAAVKGYAAYERGTLEAVTALRERAVAEQGPARLAVLEGELEQSLGRLIALGEAYPDLVANESFLRLQNDLVEVEDHLQYARRFYNGAVRDFNNTVERFPDRVLARLFRFAPAEFYAADGGARAAVVIGSSSTGSGPTASGPTGPGAPGPDA